MAIEIIRPKHTKWLVAKMNWLISQFGSGDYQNRSQIYPSYLIGEDKKYRSPDLAYSLYLFGCDRLQLDPDDYKFWVDTIDKPRVIGTYKEGTRPEITIEKKLRECRHYMMMVIAHELSHAKLLAETDISDDWLDFEPLTDLASIFFGFGLFYSYISNLLSRECENFFEQKVGYLQIDQLLEFFVILQVAQHPRNVRWWPLGSSDTLDYFRGIQRYWHFKGNPGLVLNHKGRIVVYEPGSRIDLEKQLQVAINHERFETAAKLRNQLRTLKKS